MLMTIGILSVFISDNVSATITIEYESFDDVANDFDGLQLNNNWGLFANYLDSNVAGKRDFTNFTYQSSYKYSNPNGFKFVPSSNHLSGYTFNFGNPYQLINWSFVFLGFTHVINQQYDMAIDFCDINDNIISSVHFNLANPSPYLITVTDGVSGATIHDQTTGSYLTTSKIWAFNFSDGNGVDWFHYWSSTYDWSHLTKSSGSGALSYICIRQLNIPSGENLFYFDNMMFTFNDIISPPEPPPETSTGNKIKLHYYNQQTGEELNVAGDDTLKPYQHWFGIDNFLNGDIISPSLWVGDYLTGNVNIFIDEFDTNTFITGTRVAIYSQNLFYNDGAGNGEYFQNKITWITLYNNSEYSIFLWPLNFFGFENIKTADYNGFEIGIATDKAVYNYPEQVLMAYKLPSLTFWMAHGGNPLSHIYLTDATICFHPFVCKWQPGRYTSEDTLSFTEDWVYLPPFSPSEPVNNQDTFEMGLGRVEYFLWEHWVYTYIEGLYFNYVNLGQFTAHGNITSINPSDVILGEEVQIVYDANNNGKIGIFSGETGTEVTYDFDKPSGPYGQLVLNPSAFGIYFAKIYIWDGVEYLLQPSTKMFWVNVTGTGYGEFGTGEFLECITPRVVVGENVTVIYRSFKNDSLLTVKNTRGAQTMYSMIVQNSSGYFHFKVPPYASIGKWNISMNATDILNDYFFVIADDNNYIESEESSYRLDELPIFYLKHNKRVKVIFKYDGVAYGPKLWFDFTNFTSGSFPLPDTSILKEGLWTVELWETNDRTERTLMAIDEFMITPKLPIIIETNNNGVGLILGPPFTYIAGIVLTVILTILPIIAIMQFKIENDIMKYVPLFTGLLGIVLSILLGFFPVWVIAVIIVILAIFIAIMWLQRKLV
jgi:hypothetical protein